MDKDKFLWAKLNNVATNREQNGVGTLSEKSVHAVLKAYFAAAPEQCEIKIGRMVADVFTGSEIYEIQTRAFNTMHKKLENFLPQYPVTIVHPVAATKQIIWINPQTGVLSKPHKSPIRGNIYMVFIELYRIRQYLQHNNLSICVVLLDIEEYKLLDGWSKDKKRGCTRLDKIPTNLISQTTLKTQADYAALIPPELPEQFVVKEFAKAAKIDNDLARLTLKVLQEIGVVEQTGKRVNAFVYQRCVI